MLVDRRLVFCWTGFIAISTGIVTNFSISSALRPGHWVIMLISVLVTSGKASMGILRKVMIPVISRIPVQKKIKYRFFSENAMILLRNLFISEGIFECQYGCFPASCSGHCKSE